MAYIHIAYWLRDVAEACAMILAIPVSGLLLSLIARRGVIPQRDIHTATLFAVVLGAAMTVIACTMGILRTYFGSVSATATVISAGLLWTWYRVVVKRTKA